MVHRIFPDPPIPMTLMRAKLSISWFTFGIVLLFLIKAKFDLVLSNLI